MTGQGQEWTTSCLLDYFYFKNYYKLIAKDSSKQQLLHTDPKVTQQIWCFWKTRLNNVFIIWEAKK